MTTTPPSYKNILECNNACNAVVSPLKKLDEKKLLPHIPQVAVIESTRHHHFDCRLIDLNFLLSYVCMHAHVRVHTLTYLLTYMYTYILICIYSYMYTWIHINIYKFTSGMSTFLDDRRVSKYTHVYMYTDNQMYIRITLFSSFDIPLYV